MYFDNLPPDKVVEGHVVGVVVACRAGGVGQSRQKKILANQTSLGLVIYPRQP